MGDLSVGHSRRWCGRFAAVLCLCAAFCKPDELPMDPLPNLPPTRSLQCFEDEQVYSCCEGAYRLNPSGIIAVPVGAVDYYCGGACVVETEDVLNCVASALDGFAFYNGASVEDVRYALRRGCSHTARRAQATSTIWSRIWATTLTSMATMMNTALAARLLQLL
ncbi:uncharacterized protein [Zea mays]|uniref:DUF7731 domain-containing protein n=1 Tax=Zea mays TaxID=4577 RepID=A0A804LIY7_MAIZE|nr:uncharacterized protein LOC100278949 isoform X2 [Zea mays]XP_035821865.1 uncharacterized protein LOC100278949 isoform X2 [Zea mays]|eukprot:XP_008672220.2 uncharacterized protein LOC100278949 isoform X2 [Zea mays]